MTCTLRRYLKKKYTPNAYPQLQNITLINRDFFLFFFWHIRHALVRSFFLFLFFVRDALLSSFFFFFRHPFFLFLGFLIPFSLPFSTLHSKASIVRESEGGGGGGGRGGGKEKYIKFKSEKRYSSSWSPHCRNMKT